MRQFFDDKCETVSTIGKWDETRAAEFNQLSQMFERLVPGRVISTSRECCEVIMDGRLHRGNISGGLRQSIDQGETAYPAAGDWAGLQICADHVMVRGLLRRRNRFSRQHSGKAIGEQVVAANLDYLFIVMGLDQDFNLNRLDRYLVMARRGGVQPVVILTKADLRSDSCLYVARTHSERDRLDVYAVSAKDGYGMEDPARYLEGGTTILLVGSSGAGKSTLINSLLGSEVASTGELSEGNGRGRATTTIARGYETTSGGMLIDAPGMREVQLWADRSTVDAAFGDIAVLASRCKFRDCQHQSEPGCKVRQALIEGALTQERFLNYLKLNGEVEESRESMLERKRKRFKEIAIQNKNRRKMDCT